MRREHITAILIYACAAVLFAAHAWLSGNAWIFGLLLLLLLLPPVTAATNLYVRRRIRAEIELPMTAMKHTAPGGSITFRSSAWLPAARLRCTLRIVNDLTRETQRIHFAVALPPRGRYTQQFLLQSACCGRLFVCLDRVEITDYFGIIPIRVPLKAHARMTVLPELFQSDVQLLPFSSSSDEGTAQNRGDDRSEVFQFREYQSGDDIRQIHWKLSSKLDTLLLREPSQNIDHSLLLIWDKRPVCESDVTDALAEITASVSQAMIAGGLQFDLAWTEDDEPEQRHITDSDTLLTAIPALVKSAANAACPLPDFSQYNRIFWFTAQLPPDTDDGRICYLLCSRMPVSGANVHMISPDTYREDLQRLEI